jgi:glycosyltransferase involved in cell wall biosynthesis
MNRPYKVAIAHDFFFQNGGAENVVEKLLEIYPNADIYTSIYIDSKFDNKPLIQRLFKENKIKTTFLQPFFNFNNNWLLRYFKHFFWLYPLAMRMVKIKDYDLLIISSTDSGKQVRVQNIPKIIHYCHSPTRYLNGLITETDHQNLGGFHKLILPLFIVWLKKLDHSAVRYLNKENCIWLANSIYIKSVIKNCYNIDSKVVYPPVEIQNYLQIKRKIGQIQEYYLCHGRISFHKRIDLAILACLQLGKKLKISGTSALEQQTNNLKKLVSDYESQKPEAKGLVEFLGRTTDQEVVELITNCTGFLFPGKEDFGITPIEILAAGVPIVAYQSGGALEYIKDGENGFFFDEQNVESLKLAIKKFEQIKTWDISKIKESSKVYSGEVFVENIKKIVAQEI